MTRNRVAATTHGEERRPATNQGEDQRTSMAQKEDQSASELPWSERNKERVTFKRDETFASARVLASFYHRRSFSIPLPLRSLVHYSSPSVVPRSLIIVHHRWFSAPHRALSLLLCSSPCLAVVGGWSRRVLLPCLLEVKATFFLLSGLTPALCFSSIDGLCKEGLFEEALALMSKMEDNGCLPNAVTFEIVIRALFENGENDMAEKLLREMIARGLLNG
ncbi:Pentatricopeptide repeat-containing protein [Arachis hypogaea]|nr:Pentatricopeptide repeat-containing protein [Arachis hypogaea]